MAANIFSGATDANWGTAGNWSLGSVPTSSDGHVATFDATSPACTVNASSRACNAIDFTGYTNTITMSQQITVAGNITLASGMTIAGSGALICSVAATLTSNGKTWPNALTLSGAVTFTLADAWDVDGLVTIVSTAGATIVNGFSITCGAGLTHTTTVSQTSGTTTFTMNGTGTITLGASSGSFRHDLTINTAGTITFAAAVHSYSHGTLTYTAGTVVATGSTLSIANGNTTLAIAGVTWNNITIFGNALTHTLSNNITMTGLLTLGASTNDTIVNGGTINVSGGVTHPCTSGSVYGTTIINVTGTSTLSAPSITTGEGIDNPITINAPGGTVTVSDGFRIDLSKLTYTAGTVIAGNTWATGGGGRSPIQGLSQQGVSIF